jgi:PPP family 3-phenylpropionic acid transporter
MPPQPAHSLKNLRVLQSQYFLYFAVMGVVLPYFNLYCYHIGFDGFQIGAISALKSATVVVFPLLWGILADRYRLRRAIYIICNTLSVILWMGYFFTTDFKAMMAITLIYCIFYAPLISLLEALTMDNLGARRTAYGRMRVWGSISFIGMVIVIGAVVDRLGVGVILVVVWVGSLLQALLSTVVPAQRVGKPISLQGIKVLFDARFVIFLGCAFLMLASHSAYYGYISIHLEQLGYPGVYIGIAWALASTAEITVMVGSAALLKRFSPERLLMAAFAVAIVRWLIVFQATSAIVILTSQLLHAFTYGVFHLASILYVDDLSQSGVKTLGQAVNNAVTYGLGLMVGFYLNGWLYARIDIEGMFLVSSAMAAVGGFIFGAYHLRRRLSGG